jgi:hypothetical protein
MVIFSSIYYQKDLSLPIKHYYFDFFKIGIIATVSWAIVFVLFRYAIKIPESWNIWWETIIKGCSFLALYGIATVLFDKKTLKEFLRKKPSINGL